MYRSLRVYPAVRWVVEVLSKIAFPFFPTVELKFVFPPSPVGLQGRLECSFVHAQVPGAYAVLDFWQWSPNLNFPAFLFFSLRAPLNFSLSSAKPGNRGTSRINFTEEGRKGRTEGERHLERQLYSSQVCKTRFPRFSPFILCTAWLTMHTQTPSIQIHRRFPSGSSSNCPRFLWTAPSPHHYPSRDGQDPHLNPGDLSTAQGFPVRPDRFESSGKTLHVLLLPDLVDRNSPVTEPDEKEIQVRLDVGDGGVESGLAYPFCPRCRGDEKSAIVEEMPSDLLSHRPRLEDIHPFEPECGKVGHSHLLLDPLCLEKGCRVSTRERESCRRDQRMSITATAFTQQSIPSYVQNPSLWSRRTRIFRGR